MTGVGIIGCGAISRIHINSYKEIEGVEIRAVADVNADSAKKTGEELGVPYYTNPDDLLARNDIQMVSICTPSGLHEEAAVKAAAARKNIVVEKPLEVTLEKIDHIIRACSENRVNLACIFNVRYKEGYIFLKKAIEAGRFGRLINANAFVRWYREPDYYLKSAWRGTWALDGGGALMNQSIHYIDLLQWLAGGVESIYAYTAALLHKSIQTEDTAVAALKFRNGALGVVVAGTSVYPGFTAQLQITGERGSVVIDDGIITTWAFKDCEELDRTAEQYMLKQADDRRASDPMSFDHYCHKKQLQQVVEAFRQGKDHEIDGKEARKSVEIILGIYRSAAEKKEILLPL